jgi:hypothetical protein
MFLFRDRLALTSQICKSRSCFSDIRLQQRWVFVVARLSGCLSYPYSHQAPVERGSRSQEYECRNEQEGVVPFTLSRRTPAASVLDHPSSYFGHGRHPSCVGFVVFETNGPTGKDNAELTGGWKYRRTANVATRRGFPRGGLFSSMGTRVDRSGPRRYPGMRGGRGLAGGVRPSGPRGTRAVAGNATGREGQCARCFTSAPKGY